MATTECTPTWMLQGNMDYHSQIVYSRDFWSFLPTVPDEWVGWFWTLAACGVVRLAVWALAH